MTFDTFPEASAIVSLPVQAPASTGAVPPLVRRLVDAFDAAWVDAASVMAWAAGARDRVVLLPGDPVRFPEGQDVAAVLPELRRRLADAFDIGVVAAADEDGVAALFAATRRPSLVFLRAGGFVGTLTGMHDWGDFVAAVDRLLAMPSGPLPARVIPLVAAAGGPACR